MDRIIKHWPIKLAFLLFCLMLITYIFFNEPIAHWAYPGSENRNGDLMKDFLSISGGLAVLAGLYLTFVRSRAVEETVKNQQEQIKNQHLEIGLTRDANLNEQFINAVEHLGSEREPIILGGVAELNQLASNQPEKFAEVVVNIYSSYCKSEAHYKRSGDEIKWSIIRAIVKNLCHNEVFSSFQVDLSYTNLSSISLENCRIEGWNFSYCNLPSKVFMVHFKFCNLDRTRGFLTRFTEVTFEDCELYKIFLELGEWHYPRFMGRTKISVLALDSKFHIMKMESEMLSSEFINCKISHTTFGKEFLSSMVFLGCHLKRVTFSSGLSSFQFDGSIMEKVIFRDFITSTSFRGVSPNAKNDIWENLYSKLTASLNKESDLSGNSFLRSYRNIDSSPLTEKDAYEISNHYNKLVEKYSYTKSFKIRIPEEWEKAAL